MLLGDSWHPGGLELTRVLADQLCIGPDDSVLDVASGIGTSTRFIADNFGCKVTGVDFSLANSKEAVLNSRSRHFDTEFLTGDSHFLPFADNSQDVVILECVLSSFNDKHGGVRELFRVMRPNGRIGVSDIIVEGDIPHELRSPWLGSLCVSGALSPAEYSQLLRDCGFSVSGYENESKMAMDFVEEIRKKIFLADLLIGLGKLPGKKEDVEYARRMLKVAKKCVEEGTLGYGLLIAKKES